MKKTQKNKIFPIAFLSIMTLIFSCEKSEIPPSEANPPAEANVNTKLTSRIAATSAIGATYYVSAGSDGQNTSLRNGQNPAQPWKTIQYAMDNMAPSCTLIIYGGVYNERVTVRSRLNGTAAAPTIIKGADNANAIIRGSTTTVTYLYDALMKLENVQHVKVQKLRAENSYFFGFFVENGSNNTIENCSTFNTRASGVYVGSSNNANVLNNVVKKACQWIGGTGGIGSQECISIVSSNGFNVIGNEVAESTVVGQGGEGIDAKLGSSNGEIRGNYVHDLAELGIYVDAGGPTRISTNIRIHKNRVKNTAGGFAVAGENGGTCDKIYIYNNVVWNSSRFGVELSDYVTPGSPVPTIKNIIISNNTFYNNATSSPVGDIASYITSPNSAGIVIRNNIFFGNVSSNYMFTILHNKKSIHNIARNLYFNFKPHSNGLNSYSVSDAQLNNNLYNVNPLFSNAASNNFFLQTGSPARNAATTQIFLPGTTTQIYTDDYFSLARGSSWDIGAYEFN